MKVVRIKIIYDDIFSNDFDGFRERNLSFEIALKKTSWIEFAGEWSCYPGYMKQTKGTFSQSSAKDGKFTVYFSDKEPAFFGENKSQLFLTLQDFTDSPKVGMKGKGSVHRLGAEGAALFWVKSSGWSPGHVNDYLIWKVVEVN